MSLKNFFNPRSIAIVGVSQNPKKVGHLVAKNMLSQGFSGEMYFIHPTEQEILGKKVYPDLKSINKQVDLVIYAVPAHVVLSTIDEIIPLGCKRILMYAAGFKEMNSKEGEEAEIKLQQKIHQHDLTVLGPNCIGFINTEKQINATFLKDTAPYGNIGIISQSGALGSAYVDYLNSHNNIGVSYFISLGNKSVIDESDCLEFLLQDEQTKVIGMYLENVTDGDRFRKVLAEVSQHKPVILLKGGSTQAGSKAAMSHTGSLVGDDEVFTEICNQCGAIRAKTYSDFAALLQLFSYGRVPESRNVLVLSNAGGMGVLLADRLIEKKLNLVTVSEETKEKIGQAFGDSAKITIHNPIDLLGDASAFDYERAIESTIREKDVGAVVVLLTPQANTEIMPTAEVIAKAQYALEDKREFFKPIYPVFMGQTSINEAQTFFENQKMASFYQYDRLPRLISSIQDRKEVLKSLQSGEKVSALSLSAHKLEIKTILMENKGKPYLNQSDSLKVLEYLGLKVAKTYHIASEEDVKRVLEKEGYPLVAKIASEKITHKTEVKGVITGLNTWEELMDAYTHLAELSESKKECYLQKQYSGHEIIIGTKRDVTFGTVVMVGLGGVYAELLKEVVQFVYPFHYDYFEWTLYRTKLKKLIEGYRNTPPLNITKLFETSYLLGHLMETFSQILEIDINPLMSLGEENIIVDSRLILNQ